MLGIKKGLTGNICCGLCWVLKDKSTLCGGQGKGCIVAVELYAEQREQDT